MTKTKIYILLGVGAYLLFMLISLPAQYPMMLLNAPLAKSGISLHGVSGTLWNGKIGVVSLGRVQLENVSWQVRPSRLLLGRLELNARLQKERSYLQGQIGVTLTGSRYASNLEARILVNELLSLLNIPLVKAEGTLNGFVRKLSVTGGGVSQAEGRIAWQDAKILSPQRVDLGGLVVNLETTAEGVKGTLSDTGGALQLQGVLNLDIEGGYRFNGQFSSRDSSQPMLDQALRMMGPVGADGKVQINRSGTLQQLGIQL